MKYVKKLIVVLCVALLVCFTVQVLMPLDISSISSAQAATKVKLNYSKAKMTKGRTIQLKISGTNKKVTWTSSNKKVAKVNRKGLVTAIKIGTAKITAKFGSEKRTCMITVTKPLKGDIHSIVQKKWKDVKYRFPDKFRRYTQSGQYTYYTNDYVLVEVWDIDGTITQVSLLTDAKQGLGKYTVFGIYPNMSVSKACNILYKKGFDTDYSIDEDSKNGLFQKGWDMIYFTIKKGKLDLIKY